MGKNLFPPGRPDPKDLERYGARFEIEVGPPILRDPTGSPLVSNARGQRFSRMPAMIDTGAGRTVITPLAVRAVGLFEVDYTKVTRAGGTEEKVPVLAASIHFPRYRISTIEVIQVLCCELPEQPIQCLIGRDIISRWLFTYEGTTGKWCIDEEDVAVWVEPPEGLLT